jgi:NAD(P)-dependent dehydrogenase (short-subunit alcohol dehydrogenase family)
VNAKYYGFYVQDDIRLTSKLTANVGLRYEYTTPYSDKFGQIGYWNGTGTEPATGAKGVFAFTKPGEYQTDPNRNDFGPRVGLAYSLTPETVIRAAGAIFYAPADTEVFPDEGDVNMFAVMRELVRQKYPRVILPEHPRVLDADREQPQNGPIQVVVNSAGIVQLSLIAKRRKLIAINLRGAFLVLSQAAQRVVEGGRIITLSGSVIARSLPTYGPYIASKAGVEGLVNVLANELRGRNVTVNVVAPGLVPTIGALAVRALELPVTAFARVCARPRGRNAPDGLASHSQSTS